MKKNIWDVIKKTTQGLINKFPDGHNPFIIMNCLLEECGELAAEINHAENIGLKVEKRGEHDPQKIADESKNIIWAVMRIIKYYNLENELEESFTKSEEKLKQGGYI